MRKLCRLLPVLGLSVLGAASLGATTASAAEVTRVASSFDGDNKFDLHFGVGYDFNFKQAAILREWSDPNNPKSTMVRDLLYRQMRHVVTPTMEIGLYKDLAIYAALPVVISDQRTYAFDQQAEPCVYADQASGTNPAASCGWKKRLSRISAAGTSNISPGEAKFQPKNLRSAGLPRCTASGSV